MRIFLTILLTLFLVGCSKEVSHTQYIPPTVPTVTPQNMIINFANHAVYVDEEDQLTNYVFDKSLVINFEHYLTNTTFNSLANKPALKVLLNEVQICSYSYSGTKYISNCPANVVVNDWDQIKISGIPKGQIITLTFSYTVL